MRIIPTLAAIFALPLILSACPEKPPEEPPCTLDVNKLSGQWVVKKSAPEIGDFLDPDFRVEFGTKDGKAYAIATRGPVQPGTPSPLTHKFTYALKSVSEKGEALFVQNMLKDVKKEDLEKIKNQDFFNDPARRVSEYRLYVTVDSNRCRLRISDMNAYWNKGVQQEDSNPAGTQHYLEAEAHYSMEDCPQLQWLKAVDDKGKELGEPAEVKAGEPTHFKVTTKVKDDGADGCTLSGEVWIRDQKTDTPVTVETSKGKNLWTFDATLAWEDPPEWRPIPRWAFVELYRYKTCDGKKELIRNDCNAVKVLQ